MTVGLENDVEIVGCHAEGEVGDVIIGGDSRPVARVFIIPMWTLSKS